MTAPDITFRLLDGRAAAADAADVVALHAEVHGVANSVVTAIARVPADRADRTDRTDRADRVDDRAPFAARLPVQLRQPGFVLAEAWHGDYLVGYASGMPLRTASSWWRHLTTPLPDDVTTEHPGRTFALLEMAVRAAWRRQGIATTLHDMILAGRPEERATAIISPAAAPAQGAFTSWGWRKIARTREPGSPVSDVLTTPLPTAS
jgi:GNAT superfamily N-acetyltransferase